MGHAREYRDSRFTRCRRKSRCPFADNSAKGHFFLLKLALLVCGAESHAIGLNKTTFNRQRAALC